ncbi:MAG TPA: DUF2600 domain-containing protein [Firmicutes bacterium]|nr:DUF2600 domain-containing protein [Bacillota bacterium]
MNRLRASTLLYEFYTSYKPKTHDNLNGIKNRAMKIPDSFLKQEAIKSINSKTFHCYGASFYTYLVKTEYQGAFLKFVTSYQTISDYLDNLIDQTTVINETNFRRLHQSMLDVFIMQPPTQNYYQYQIQQDDSGYLKELVLNCQSVLQLLPNYKRYQAVFLKFAYLYVDLQVFKHLKVTQRELKLRHWYEKNKRFAPELTWYEFSAASGSTLGIFALLAYLLSEDEVNIDPDLVFQAFMPSVQLLHIMLDYFIDLEEDEEEGELNFFGYYENLETGVSKLLFQYQAANLSVEKLPLYEFHHMINDGLLALYLAEGVQKSETVQKYRAYLMRYVKFRTKLLFVNAAFVLKQYEKEKRYI